MLKKLLDKILRFYFEKILDVKNFYDKSARFYDLAHHVQTLWADNIHRIAVVEAANFKESDMVLDVGTGTSLAAILAINKTYTDCTIRVVGIDLSTKMLQKAKRNLKKFKIKHQIFNINCDARYLSLRESIFNKIISVYALGGVYNLPKAFMELINVAKNNTIFSLGEMTAPPQEKSLFLRKFHEICIEPVINLVWQFKDLNLNGFFKRFNIKILKKKYFQTKYIGSMTLIVGKLDK